MPFHHLPHGHGLLIFLISHHISLEWLHILCDIYRAIGHSCSWWAVHQEVESQEGGDGVCYAKKSTEDQSWSWQEHIWNTCTVEENERQHQQQQSATCLGFCWDLFLLLLLVADVTAYFYLITLLINTEIGTKMRKVEEGCRPLNDLKLNNS